METYKERLAEEHRTAAFWRDVFTEFIATFLLVSVQSALPLTWGHAAGIGGPVYTALGMGFVVCSMAWTFGDFSGGHMNPAVTFSMAISAKITVVRGNVVITSNIVQIAYTSEKTSEIITAFRNSARGLDMPGTSIYV